MDDDSRRLALEAFKEAHRRAGGHTPLARICECSASNIFQLLEKGSLLPERFVLKVEAATGVSRHDLRPDTYPRDDAPPAPARENGLEGLAA